MTRTGSASKLLVTGAPQSGKTTVVTRLVDLLRQASVAVGGFVTSEQRVDGRRVGFVVHDLAGPCAQLAHEDLDSPIRVGRFGVDVAAFEQVALPALRAALDGDAVVIIDEVARMELASTAFTGLVEQALRLPRAVVATAHAHAHPFTDALKRRPDVVVLDVNQATRDQLPRQLLATLTGR